MNKISLSKKSIYLRLIYLFLGISIILSINLVFYFIVKGIYIPVWTFFIFIILVYFFWKLTKIINLKYEFTDEFIAIYPSKNKGFKLYKKQVDKIEKINNISLLNFGIKHNAFMKETYYISDVSQVLKIYMNDGQVFYISPKSFPLGLLDHNNK